MAFSIKQLLFSMAVVAFGAVAIGVKSPIPARLFDLLTLSILIAMAYRAWLSHGEARAFCVGFVIWAVLYFLLFKTKFDVGLQPLLVRAYSLLVSMTVATGTWEYTTTTSPWVGYFPNFTSVCHSLLLLLLGVIGGWITVYLYRKRQRMPEP